MAERAYVVYWTLPWIRSEYIHALEYAIRGNNELGQPVVYFGLTENGPEESAGHCRCLLNGRDPNGSTGVASCLGQRDRS